MSQVHLKIQTLEDAKEGKGILPTPVKLVHQVKDVTVGILEAGTVLGNPTVNFCLEIAPGEWVIHEMTAGAFEGLVAGYKGATLSFRDKRARGN